MTNFCKNLKALRAKKGIKQAHIAKKVGVSSNEVSLWERGLYEPRIGLAAEVAKLFGVTLDEMTNGDFTDGER